MLTKRLIRFRSEWLTASSKVRQANISVGDKIDIYEEYKLKFIHDELTGWQKAHTGPYIVKFDLKNTLEYFWANPIGFN